MTTTPERRYTRGNLEFRAADATEGATSPGTLAGYALKFDRLSQNLGGFVERIAPGAVDKSIADGLDVLARYNHDDNMLLGRTASGTVRLSVDGVGLLYEVDLPDTQAGRDLAVLAARGDVHQSSFAFETIRDSWDTTEQGFPLRTLEQIRLVDVAPVNTPAYLDTSSALRSLAEARALDPETVRAAADSNRLADIFAAADAADAEPGPSVAPELDGAERAAETPAEVPQVDNHGSIDILRRRLALRRTP